MTRALIGAGLLLSLAACTKTTGPDGDDTSATDDTSSSATDEICDDGADNDGDGDADCDDSDCSDVCDEVCDDGVDNDADGDVDCDDSECVDFAPCTWPERLGHELDVLMDGREVTCEIGWFEEDVQVPDCRTHYKTQLDELTGDTACADCDRTFTGTFNYTVDSCTEQFEGDPPPTTGDFGLKFVSDSTWELWGRNDSGVWEKGVDLNFDGEWYVFTSTDPLNFDSGECDNDPLYVGDLTTTLMFKPI
jgi:hypothetical protein